VEIVRKMVQEMAIATEAKKMLAQAVLSSAALLAVAGLGGLAGIDFPIAPVCSSSSGSCGFVLCRLR